MPGRPRPTFRHPVSWTVIPSEIAHRGPDTEAFRPEIAEFLLEFSIGVHRHSMYPPGHPSLKPVAASALSRLQPTLVAGELRLGVLRDQFLSDDRLSDPRHPVLAELAARFHDHEIAAIRFREGIAVAEIRELLGKLAPEVERGARPLGALPEDDRPRWPHITIESLHYDTLTLVEGGDAGDESRTAELWMSLVRSVMDVEDGPVTGVDSAALASAVREQSGDPLQMSLVAGYLAPLLESLGEAGEGDSRGVRAGLDGFLTTLGPEARADLLRTGGDAAWRMDLVRAASRSLDLAGLLDLVDAAAEASGQPISNSMTRLLTKMAAHGAGEDPAAQHQADESVRENIRSLLRDWTLADPNPDGYSGVLDALSRPGAAREIVTPEPSHVEEALRVLTISVEVDHWTPRAENALRVALDGGRLGDIYEAIDALCDLPGARPLIDALRKPIWVRRAVSSEQLEEGAVARVALEAGPAGIPALMDGLVAGRTRESRRVLFDTLAHIGDAVIPEIEARFPTPRWFVARNLLNLLAVLPGASAVIDPLEYLKHDDRRVRRAALPVALKEPTRVEVALIMALSDRDERLVQLALLHLGDDPPAEVLRAVITRVILAGRSAELRILAVRALRDRRSLVVRDALVELVTRGLNAPAEHARAGAGLALAALQVLVPQWPHDPRVRAVIDRARGSDDPAIRRAVDSV